jgi:hypothetical protein
MNPWLAALVLLLCSPASGEKPARWEMKLKSAGLSSFERGTGALWTIQQGVLFLTPERILLYQVNRTAEQAKLAPRGSGGGAGNFFLNIRVLNAQDGQVVRSLDLPTNAGISVVLRTRDGAFLVRTGTTVYLYSREFKQTAAKNLPIERTAQWEDWQIQVSTKGEHAVLLHEEVFSRPELLADNTVLHDGKATVEVQVLNAGTLETEKTFRLEHTLAFWAPVGEVLFSSNPAHSYGDGQVGEMDFNGSWSSLKAEFPMDTNSCHRGLAAIDPERLITFGCGDFTVLAASGKSLFAVKDLESMFKSAAAGGSELVVRRDRFFVERGGSGGGLLTTRPHSLDLYDLENYKHRTSIPIQNDQVSYAVSERGDLAVVEGDTLRVFAGEK